MRGSHGSHSPRRERVAPPAEPRCRTCQKLYRVVFFCTGPCAGPQVKRGCNPKMAVYLTHLMTSSGTGLKSVDDYEVQAFSNPTCLLLSTHCTHQNQNADDWNPITIDGGLVHSAECWCDLLFKPGCFCFEDISPREQQHSTHFNPSTERALLVDSQSSFLDVPGAGFCLYHRSRAAHDFTYRLWTHDIRALLALPMTDDGTVNASRIRQQLASLSYPEGNETMATRLQLESETCYPDQEV